jgi:hypothetical protein
VLSISTSVMACSGGTGVGPAEAGRTFSSAESAQQPPRILGSRCQYLSRCVLLRQNASYTPDEYKVEMLSPDVVVMTHRGTTKGMRNGKEVTESHRSLHVFQKLDGRWQVVANAQLPIAQ